MEIRRLSFLIYCYYYQQLTAAPRCLRPIQQRTLLLHTKLFIASLFTPSEKVTISLQSFLMTSSHSNRELPAFCLALDGWSKRTIFGNLPSFISRTCPSHLNLSLTIALESVIEPHFLSNLLFQIPSVSRVPKTICRQFL